MNLRATCRIDLRTGHGVCQCSGVENGSGVRVVKRCDENVLIVLGVRSLANGREKDAFVVKARRDFIQFACENLFSPPSLFLFFSSTPVSSPSLPLYPLTCQFINTCKRPPWFIHSFVRSYHLRNSHITILRFHRYISTPFDELRASLAPN